MNDKFFLDTNVFVYSFESSASAKARRAAQLVRQGISTGKGVISFQVVQEFFNVALKRFAKPMTPEEAEQYLAAVFRPLLAVHSSPALYHEALEVVRRYRLAWYDGLIVASALQGQCGTLYSEDLQHGQRIRDLRVQNPFLKDVNWFGLARRPRRQVQPTPAHRRRAGHRCPLPRPRRTGSEMNGTA